MENASKALLIAGAILIAILLIAIAMYVYSQSQGNVNQAMASLDVQQIQSLNQAWLNYEGKQTGSQVKALMNRLASNANNYREEPEKIVGVDICQAKSNLADVSNDNSQWAQEADTGTKDQIDALIQSMSNISARVEARHVYWVKPIYHSNGLIVNFRIFYNETQYNNDNAAGGGAAATAP